ncbi:hypothetical protein [Amycolatopsis dendrobii]|uniref:hypothetical protein n=1 Tax=Amycolatopsis dendrobii TaxID=2760662 RepID=UPI001FEB87E6|nr:hypothetical protein [Amycolatopsis dendrobii]
MVVPAREFALLRLIGTTRGQIMRTIPLALLNIALRGTPLPSGTPMVLVGIVGGAFLLSLLSLGLSTRITLRAKPIEAIGLRE